MIEFASVLVARKKIRKAKILNEGQKQSMVRIPWKPLYRLQVTKRTYVHQNAELDSFPLKITTIHQIPDWQRKYQNPGTTTTNVKPYASQWVLNHLLWIFVDIWQKS